MKPEVSVGMGLAVGVMVWGIYQHAIPSLVDHRTVEAGDPHAASAERTATWTAAAAVAGISLIAKDPTIFVIGGAFVIAGALWHKHANMVNPATGRATALASITDVLDGDDFDPSDAYVPVGA